MKRPRLIRGAVAVLTFAVLSACQSVAEAPTPQPSPPPVSPAVPSTSAATTPAARPSVPSTRSATPSSVPTQAPRDTRKGTRLDKPYVVQGVLVVSRWHAISAAYTPARVGPYGLTAAADAALSRMAAAAQKAGLRLRVRSGYRSYATQAAIFARQLRRYPSEAMARRYNAAAGRSEHQTGLAVDLWDGSTWGLAVARTRLGTWLWQHAPEYGFILRYPPGKESVTGYAYEPWHFRYIGVEHSRAFGAKSTTTLEEYLGIA